MDFEDLAELHSARIFACQFCPRRLKTKRALTYHQRKQHPQAHRSISPPPFFPEIPHDFPLADRSSDDLSHPPSPHPSDHGRMMPEWSAGHPQTPSGDIHMRSPTPSDSGGADLNSPGRAETDNQDPDPPAATTLYHSTINGRICAEDGGEIPPNSAPPPRPELSKDNYGPFADRAAFESAELLYRSKNSSAGFTNQLLELWAATLAKHNDFGPFKDHKEMCKMIDDIKVGDAPWKSFTMEYNGPRPPENQQPPRWMTDKHEVWYRDPHEVIRNMLANPDFKNEFDYAPMKEFTADGKPRRKDFMSGSWAWRQADEIAKDAITHGSTFVPIILGSDKTTVSVATGSAHHGSAIPARVTGTGAGGYGYGLPNRDPRTRQILAGTAVNRVFLRQLLSDWGV